MKLILARALMVLACRCLGESRRDWGRAMLAEFDVATTNGVPLIFAVGCLIGALRQMPASHEGRFVLTTYALALGIMLPMAAVQIGCAVFGLPYLFPGLGGLGGTLSPAQEIIAGGAYRAAVPSLAALLLVSGIGQLRIAWLLLERDWRRVTTTGLAILAAIATLVIFLGSLFLDASQAVVQGGILSIELLVLVGLSQWSADLALRPPENVADK